MTVRGSFRRTLWFALVWALGQVLPAGGAPARAGEITVFAAASTSTALSEVAELYEAAPKAQGDTVRLIFAATSTLAKQIVEGAPADVVLLASAAWMDYLADRNAIEPESRVDLLGNRLALITPAGRPITLEIVPGLPLSAALDGGWLAIGDPDHVPAGIYAKAALESLGVWAEVAGKTARAADVRAALALVDRGEAAAGIVYQSDVAIGEAIGLTALFPLESHPAIVYPIAVSAGRKSPAVERFYRFLRSPDAWAVFLKHGFRWPFEGNCGCRKSRPSSAKP